MAARPDGGYCVPWPTRAEHPVGGFALIAEIITGTVRLPDVRCARTPAIFDIDAGEESHELAATICRHCLSQACCLEWACAQPAGPITGILGGQMFGHPARSGVATYPAQPRTCSVDGCDRDARSRGLCHAHYMRMLRSGPPDPRRPA